MIRRIVLILFIAGLVTGAAVGLWVFLRPDSPAKMIARADVALRAKNYDRAIELARAYRELEPDNWRSYYVEGRSQLRLKRIEEARAVLKEGLARHPDSQPLTIALADSHIQPAERILASGAAGADADAIETAIENLREAIRTLAEFEADDPKGELDVRQSLALRTLGLGQAQRLLAARRRQDAAVAAGAGAEAERVEHSRRAEEADRRAEETLDRAARLLLAVACEDPGREPVVDPLIRLARERNDDDAIGQLSQAMEDTENAPPLARTLVVMYALSKIETPSEAEYARTAEALDGILQNHPDATEALLARAEVALGLADYDTLEACVRKALDGEGVAVEDQGRARMIRARGLVRQRKWAEAEQVLYALKMDFPRWAEPFYLYALTTHKTGKKELAREAMRTIIATIDKDHLDAHRFLAETFLEEERYEQALEHARRCYDLRPDTPSSLRLIVQAAIGNKQPELARDLLDEAMKREPPDPGILVEVSRGYARLGRNEQARTAAEKAAEVEAGSETAIQVARARMLLGEAEEAERILEAETDRRPDSIELQTALGEFYVRTGRTARATEHYRRAAELAPDSAPVHLALARALLNTGLVEEAEAETRHVLNLDPGNADAALLLSQIRAVRGEISIEQMVQQFLDEGRPGLPLAMTHLKRGAPEKCINICLAELEQTPDNADARALLALAYQAMGEHQKCKEQLREAVRRAPDQFLAYLRLAAVLARTMAPETVEIELGAVPGARRDLVDLALGWLLGRIGQPRGAAEAYGRLASRPDAPEESRNRARLLRARALVAAGHPDRALIELDQLATDDDWRRIAQIQKVTLLASLEHVDEADQILGALVDEALETRRTSFLQQAVQLYARMGRTARALTLCTRLEALDPKDPTPHLLRAAVLVSDGRGGKAVESYHKAIELHPSNFSTHILLARTLDAEDRPSDALQALDRLADMGQTGHALAAIERGRMMAGWGLPARAIEAFTVLENSPLAGDPRITLAVGRAYAALGENERAAEVLTRVPTYVPQHLPAQQVLAQVQPTAEAKAAVLAELAEDHSANPTVVDQWMAALVEAGRPQEALKAYRDFFADRPVARVPPGLSVQAIRIHLGADDRAGAADLCAQLSQATENRAPLWRFLAAILAPADQADAALARLPEDDTMTPRDVFAALALAPHPAPSAAGWHTRLQAFVTRLADADPPQELPLAYLFLAHLAAGDVAAAQATLEGFAPEGFIGREAVVEMVDAAENDPKAAAAEAAELLRATLAGELGLPEFGREVALEVLRARPTCQWAGGLAAPAPGGDPEGLRRVLEIIQPSDGLVALMVRASLHMSERELDEAAEVLKQAAEIEHDVPALVALRAIVLEKAGRLTEALPLHVRLWEATKNPASANNAAYLVSRLHSDDPLMLAKAREWAEAAVKATPQAAAFRDTLGWIAHLQGHRETARHELRQAVRRMPGSVEVHYHLGMAEAAAGFEQFARWHLARADDIARQAEADGRLVPSEADIAQHAREALEALEKPKS